MEHLKAHSHNSTKLSDRILWFDGDSTVNAKYLIERISTGKSVDSLFVEELTNEIKQFNANVPKKEQILVKQNVQDCSFEWNIPDEYKSLDVISYVAEKLFEIDGSSNDIEERELRCVKELEIYRKLKLFDTLRTLIYIINTLIEKNLVWGVGRGSSVSSYVLYLIGVHDIDSFQYGLNIEDFLRTE